jgi:cyclase
MLFPRLIPILLIENQRLVKTLGFESTSYVGDPLNTIRIFNEKEVDEIIVLDVSASRTGVGPDFNYLEQIASECFMPMTYGGGITSSFVAKKIMECGIEKVSINSSYLSTPNIALDISSQLGSSSTVLSLDVTTSSNNFYLRNTFIPFDEHVKSASNLGFGEILIQDVSKDGNLKGPNLELVRRARSLTSLPIVYAGGVSSIEQCADVWKAGATGVGAGAWFVYRGALRAVMITYPKYKKVTEVFKQSLDTEKF